MAKIILIYVPCKNKQEAELIAKELLIQKLTFCTNIIDSVNSFYRWEDQLCHDNEALLLVKTTKKLEKKVFLEIKNLHSYKIPGIFSFQLDSLNDDYDKWVKSCLK